MYGDGSKRVESISRIQTLPLEEVGSVAAGLTAPLAFVLDPFAGDEAHICLIVPPHSCWTKAFMAESAGFHRWLASLLPGGATNKAPSSRSVLWWACPSDAIDAVRAAGVLQGRNVGPLTDGPHETLVYDKLTGRDCSGPVSGRSSTKVQPLSVADAKSVHDAWPYSGNVPDCIEIIFECLENRPSAAAISCGGGSSSSSSSNNNTSSTAARQLLCWALTRHDGSIGMLHTREASRGRGLATKVVRALASNCRGHSGAQSHAVVSVANAASLRVFERCGFRALPGAHNYFVRM